ncbi:succinylglutamate desuccinylase [Paraburkholderia acidisoli]|uniref:Succinylglutamate desuccinylase n=1 Tax=Paraburkholderia acidisoli TaxID=2571748 RepID=A0A7Z2GH73_9BURK|nr:succinylglutamate desuccinylase [Paraburkholderia acidisoli]QGZ61755.1 succinylglutamate desuccinylase [Paraburkholderia acidisoli]
MTSSADLAGDFLAYSLAGARPATPAAARGVGAHGLRWQWLDDGILLLEPANVTPATRSVLLSAGIHGDETAPIEMLSRLVADLAAGRAALACRVLVVLGNLDAMRAAKRYLDDDLNRLFGAHAQRATRAPGRETPRAAVLEAAAERFFAAASGAAASGAGAPLTRWHLDLHTAIRASAFEQFALLPHTSNPGEHANGNAPARAIFDWLADARIAAVLIHTEPGVTYSAFTADRCGALACTLELGKVRPFGQNDLARFASADAALRRLVAGEVASPGASESSPMPRVFTVIGQITKQSDAFALNVAADVPNFTPFARGTVLAEDGAYRYVVQHEEERIVFPNPGVKPGLRAGLLVVETTRETLAALR